MAGVIIGYKGSTIANIQTTGSKTLKTQGKYCEDDITVDYVVPTEKNVNLYDWDGTLLDSYTTAEAQALTSLPSSPGAVHDLLTFQGWNWTLADIKSWLTSNPHGRLDVGAIYKTSDNQDHNYWGNPRLDSAATVSMHKRASTSGFSFNAYRSLEKINIPNGATTISVSAFSSCTDLKHISLPNGMTTIGNNGFNDCYSLEELSLPKSLTSIGGASFSNCYALKRFFIPVGVTSVGNYGFSNCYSLTSIDIHSGVTGIGVKAFSNNYALNDIVIKGKPSLSSVNAFENGPSTRRFYAYRNDLSYFETATNWSSLYTQFYAIEDYVSYLNSIGIDA